MKTVVLISCTKSKRTYPCEAVLLYDVSSKFKKSLTYAKIISTDIYIISTKHGLLSLDTVVEPYNETLIGKPKEEKQKWGSMVVTQIKEFFDIESTRFIILAGKDYYEPLLPHLYCKIPLCGATMFNWDTKMKILMTTCE